MILVTFGKFETDNRFCEGLEWLGIINFQTGLLLSLKQILCILLLNSLLFSGHLFQKYLHFRQQYSLEIKQYKNQKGFMNFGHFLWARLVFWVFSLWEKPRSFSRLRSIVFAPLLEELLYRGLIFGAYRDHGYFKVGDF